MTAAAILDVARRQLGTVESPKNSNRTPYGRAYGMDGNAWCAMFTWWVFQQAGLGTLHPKTAYTPTLADWFRKRGQWGSAPRVGALVLFDFPGDGVDRISHVGIVEAVNADRSIITIEGNTSAGTTGSQRDGGGVYRRARRTGIVGYGYPAYPGAPATAPAKTTAPAQPLLRRGSTGPAVRELQRVLAAWYPSLRLAVDGDFGPMTEQAVKLLQKKAGITVDGVVGPQVRGVLRL